MINDLEPVTQNFSPTFEAKPIVAKSVGDDEDVTKPPGSPG